MRSTGKGRDEVVPARRHSKKLGPEFADAFDRGRKRASDLNARTNGERCGMAATCRDSDDLYGAVIGEPCQPQPTVPTIPSPQQPLQRARLCILGVVPDTQGIGAIDTGRSDSTGNRLGVTGCVSWC